MKNKHSLAVLGTLVAGLAFYAHDGKASSVSDLVEKGRYVATAADCSACHTAPGGAAMAGGYSIASPMGPIISSNITPSKKAGIGNWTEAQFARAVREGISPSGHLYPAMPYTSYSRMSDDDIHALWVYLTSEVSPVDEAPKQKTHLAFPFNIRWLMTGWNMVFASGSPMNGSTYDVKGAARGKYLVEALAHCSTCHTPRNVFFAENNKLALSGGKVGSWIAPNITPDKVSGIGGWSHDEIFNYLRNGSAPGKAQAGGPMAEAIEHSLRKLSDDDLNAITDYLQTVPAVHDPQQKSTAYSIGTVQPVSKTQIDIALDRTPQNMADSAINDGNRLYMDNCASCHQPNGTGTEDQFYPSLTHNTATGAPLPNNLVMAIVNGIHRETNQGTVAMPAFGKELSDEQIAAVSNYVAQRFGNNNLKVTAQQVQALRGQSETPLFVKMAKWGVFLLILPVVIIIFGVMRFIRSRRRL